MSATTSGVLTFGNRTVNLSDLPPATVLAMVNKGISHHMGNVQAAKISGWKESFREANNGEEPSADQIAAKRAELDEAAWQSLLNGTVTQVASRGPRGTTVETLARAIAEKQLAANLKRNGVNMPSGKETVELPTKDNGTVRYTRAQMIDRRLNHPTHGPAIRKQAEKEFATLGKGSAAAEGLAGEDMLDA